MNCLNARLMLVSTGDNTNIYLFLILFFSFDFVYTKIRITGVVVVVALFCSCTYRGYTYDILWVIYVLWGFRKKFFFDFLQNHQWMRIYACVWVCVYMCVHVYNHTWILVSRNYVIFKNVQFIINIFYLINFFNAFSDIRNQQLSRFFLKTFIHL